MIRFLRLFSQFRDIESLIETQSESLESEVRAHETTKNALEVANIALDSERARRVSADTVAAERREEIDRLLIHNRELMDQSHSIMSDRLKSLDALNLRLMDTRTVEQTPDLAKHQAFEKLKVNVLQDIRAKERAMDFALVDHFRKPRITMNESPTPPAEETAA